MNEELEKGHDAQRAVMHGGVLEDVRARTMRSIELSTMTKQLC